MTLPLPKFKSPPLVETALGIEFEPIVEFEIPHFGLFWNTIRDDYPKSLVQPPVQSRIERFKGQNIPLNLFFSQTPEVRCWFLDKNEDWLLQVQKNQFLSNWRASGNSKTPYPHYEKVSDHFFRGWKQFTAFLDSEKFALPQILQCEVSYINHIEVESHFANLHMVFPSLANIKANSFLDSPETATFRFVYVIPENRGRLYLNMQHVLRHADLKEVFQLTLTAKVLLGSSNEDNILEALNLGREWAVKGFADFTSAEMHQIWGRRE